MQISLLTLPKDRCHRVPSDDTVLILPNVLGVFDGATAPQKHTLKGISSGRWASQAAAQVVAQLAVSDKLFSLSQADICGEISARIRAASEQHGMEGKPSTTMALAVFEEEQVRLLLVGDSSIRINGTRLIQCKKPIDDVSTQSRLAVREVLSLRHADVDELEALSRFVLFEGYTEALQKAILTPSEVAHIRDKLVHRFADMVDSDTLLGFLNNGVRSQYRLANRTDHPMGFSTLNGDETSLVDIIDLRLSLDELTSIEVFSDGYFLPPDSISVSAWEQAFTESETEDFHKLHRFANVKGSTSSEFADDRSVIVADAINGSKVA